MSLVFGVLVAQMAFLLLLLLPLPHPLRVRIMKVVDAMQRNSNLKVGLVFTTVLLGLQFWDCVNKLTKYSHNKNPYYANTLGGMLSDQLASKFYAQRNLYISGAVLYLEVAIGTVVTILRKLVKKEAEIRASSKKDGSSDASEADKYRELIRQKEVDIAAFKKQISGLQTAYDGLTEPEVRSKDD